MYNINVCWLIAIVAYFCPHCAVATNRKLVAYNPVLLSIRFQTGSRGLEVASTYNTNFRGFLGSKSHVCKPGNGWTRRTIKNLFKTPWSGALDTVHCDPRQQQRLYRYVLKKPAVVHMVEPYQQNFRSEIVDCNSPPEVQGFVLQLLCAMYLQFKSLEVYGRAEPVGVKVHEVLNTAPKSQLISCTWPLRSYQSRSTEFNW